MSEMQIGKRKVGSGHPIYFIAEIGSNHEGSLDKAMHLCTLAKQAGADCAKFQHYRAVHLASRDGFAGLDLAHYKDNPYDVFKKYEVPWEWTAQLKAHCDSIDIEFMSTPYDIEAVDHLEPYVNAYKIGSGDITYHQLIRHIIDKGKPILLSTGASSFEDFSAAYWLNYGRVSLCVMQCNTNYNPDADPGASLNLKVISNYAIYSNVVAGLSCHTEWDIAVPAAVGLGARVIEAHFTDNKRTNLAPDTPFAMDIYDFASMVIHVRQLETMLGDGVKKVEDNEKETVILQRRSIRAAQLLRAGTIVTHESVSFLRPAPLDSLPPYVVGQLIGKELRNDIQPGQHIRLTDIV